jgi:hypothetical protein
MLAKNYFTHILILYYHKNYSETSYSFPFSIAS